MAAHAFADDLARGDIERRKQSRGSVALVVVGHRAGAALLQRKSGLGAIERLDLAFLVDRQHQRLVRRVEVKPDNVLNLLTKLRVVGELETARQMRLEPMRRLDALHARMAEADRLGHLAQRPVRALRRLFVERHGDDALDRRRLKRRLAPRPGRVSFEPGGAARDVTISPPVDRSLGLTGRADNRRPAAPCAHISTIRARQTSFCGVFRPATHPSSRARSAGDNWMRDSLSIQTDSHDREPLGIPPLVTEH